VVVFVDVLSSASEFDSELSDNDSEVSDSDREKWKDWFQETPV